MTDKERFYLCLAEVLRELRAEHGWSVRELSRESGMSERLIRKLERGTDVGRVGAGKIMGLADAFGVTPYGVFRRVDERMGQ